MKVLTSSQMFSAEQAQVNRGMSFTRLMENAGSACARAVRERFASLEQSRGLICVLCGKGKNGGDGFVIARKLALSHRTVELHRASLLKKYHASNVAQLLVALGGLPHAQV